MYGKTKKITHKKLDTNIYIYIYTVWRINNACFSNNCNFVYFQYKKIFIGFASLGFAWLRFAWLGLAWLGLAWLGFYFMQGELASKTSCSLNKILYGGQVQNKMTLCRSVTHRRQSPIMLNYENMLTRSKILLKSGENIGSLYKDLSRFYCCR